MKTKDLKIEYIEELADVVMNKIDVDEDDFYISVIGKYKEIKEFLRSIISGYDVNIDDIELVSEDGNGYSNEYEFGIWANDGVINIGCQPAKHEGEYLTFYGNILYIFDDCNSRFVNYLCDFDEGYSVSVGEEECGCDECTCCEDKPYVINVKVNLDTDEAEDIIRKVRDDFYKEIGIFKKLLDF